MSECINLDLRITRIKVTCKITVLNNYSLKQKDYAEMYSKGKNLHQKGVLLCSIFKGT